ncbi:MAG TPA: GntR family transcriptional regulator [Anaerolineales bacterium]
MVALDFRSKEPIYRQIVNQIQDRLGSGELEPGQQLPTVRQLATELGVNFNTVARAYRLLDEQGVISTQHGRGTYALGRRSAARPGRSQLERLARGFAREAARLGFRPEQVAETIGFVLEEWDQRGRPVG